MKNALSLTAELDYASKPSASTILEFGIPSEDQFKENIVWFGKRPDFLRFFSATFPNYNLLD